MMMRPRPTTDRRVASHNAPTSAPHPDARHQEAERVRPPWKTVAAKIGISTEYGTPTRLTSASSRMIERIGRKSKRTAILENCCQAPARFRRALGSGDTHQKQRDDDADVADAVDEEALASPMAAMMMPAIEGPISRATFTIDEFSAIALRRSSWSRSS